MGNKKFVIFVFGFKNCLTTCRGISGTRIGLIHFQTLLLRQQGIGIALITVELEVGFSGRFADDKYYHSLLIICDPAFRQFYLLLLLVLLTADYSEGIRQI